MRCLLYIYIIISYSLLTSCSESSSIINSTNSTDTTKIKLIDSFNINVKEPSGLAYKTDENILYVVSDNAPYVYKISIAGQVMDSIYTGGIDMEGISFSNDFTSFYVVEEKFKRVDRFSLNGNFIDSFRVNINSSENHGLEGIAVNKANGNIFVANQKNPCLLIELTGSGIEINRTQLDSVLEISDILYDDSLNCLWMVSAVSKTINKITTTGILLDSWSIPVTDAEGITVHNDRIYIVSDSEQKLYIFKRY
jgi:uncharacterized protein YjiK